DEHQRPDLADGPSGTLPGTVIPRHVVDVATFMPVERRSNIAAVPGISDNAAPPRVARAPVDATARIDWHRHRSEDRPTQTASGDSIEVICAQSRNQF